jgi:transcriptional regulator with XRE-family HTH domain
MGYTDAQLADFFEIAESTLNNWKLEKAGFMESLKAGKEIADAEVTASLYERATGYKHRETKVFCSNGEITTHEVDRLYPPDPLSIKYWLNNRQKDRWREKVEVEGANSDTLADSVSKLIDKLPN